MTEKEYKLDKKISKYWESAYTCFGMMVVTYAEIKDNKVHMHDKIISFDCLNANFQNDIKKIRKLYKKSKDRDIKTLYNIEKLVELADQYVENVKQYKTLLKDDDYYYPY